MIPVFFDQKTSVIFFTALQLQVCNLYFGVINLFCANIFSPKQVVRLRPILLNARVVKALLHAPMLGFKN
jgi:hypothetical protein